MGTGYSDMNETCLSDMTATGSSPEMAINRLMKKVGYENYTFYGGNSLELTETTKGNEGSSYNTNVILRQPVGNSGYTRGACIDYRRRNCDNNQNCEVYYRAWFGIKMHM